ncbi:MAG: YabP/YqfC family sporulation protein [Erysipelotrichales bacterium]|nr:YabP/YqfC family sporulation protein [Erysipelotrichales bacterium]
MVHISQKYIRIEEYISLVSIQDSILEIQDKHTLIKIIGQDLKITALNSEEIIIEGKIQEVIFP